MKGWIRRHPVVTFAALTYGLSWLLWVPAAAAPNGPSGVLGSLWPFGSFAPSLSGLVVAWILEGRAAWRQLGRSLGRWRVGFRWYVWILLLPWLAAVPAALAHWMVAGTLDTWPDLRLTALLPLFLVIVVAGGPLNEELGWRWFAQRRLQEGRSALTASLIVGLMWSLWHLPLFFIPEASQAGVPIGWFVLEVLPVSVLLAWVFNSTGGSVLMAILLHGTFNTVFITLQPSVQSRIDVAMAVLVLSLVVLAVFATRSAGPRTMDERASPGY